MWINLLNHGDLVESEHPEWGDKKHYPNQEDLVIFVLNGNQGSHEQFPIIMNSVEKYANYLTEYQK